MSDRNERARGRPTPGQRGITVLSLVLLILAIAVAAVVVSRTLAR